MINKLSELNKLHPERLSAKAVLLAGGKILMLEKPNGRWDLPGGRIEPGESALAGLRREILEEVGIKIRTARFIAGWEKSGDDGNSSTKDIIALFLGSLSCKPSPSNISLSREHVNGAFLTFKDASRLPLAKHHSRALQLAQAHLVI